jgi:hypothetical protein
VASGPIDILLESHPLLPSFSGPFLTALRVLLTLAVIIAIAIAKMAPSTTGGTRFRPVVINIILVNYLIPIQWSNGQDVAWFALLAAWRLNR